MSRTRASTAFAAIATAVAIAAGTAAFTSVAATAAPKVHYPPPPPSLVVNRGVVKYGATVRATGVRYASREKVYITILFTPQGSHRTKVVKTAVAHTDRKGTFVINMRMTQPGVVIIKAIGKSSHKSASAFVNVISGKHGNGGWVIRNAAFTTGSASPTSTAPPGDAGLAIAGLGVLGLAGSATFTHQAARRRRRKTVAA